MMIDILTLSLALAAIYGIYRLWIRWLSKPRPSDIPAIKAKLEDAGHRVIDIQPDGFIAGKRYRLSYRKYRATVRSTLGGPDWVKEVGIWANFLGMRGVVDLERRHA